MEKYIKVLSLLVAGIPCFVVPTLYGGDSSSVGEKRNAYLATAAFWLHPGLPKESVVRFLGEPDFTNKIGSIYLYFIEPGVGAAPDAERKKFARVFFNEKNEVVDVIVEKFESVQSSKNFHKDKKK